MLRWIASVLLAVTFGVAGCTAADEPKGDSVGDPCGPGGRGRRLPAGDRSRSPRTRRTGWGSRRHLSWPAGPVGKSATLVIPYAAVVYDADGEAWTFASPAPLTYKRAPIVIDSIKLDSAILTSGPAPGTAVVTVGASELVGMEAGISGEE